MVKKDIANKKTEAYAKVSKAKGKAKITKLSKERRLKKCLKKTQGLLQDAQRIKKIQKKRENSLHVYFGGVCDKTNCNREMTNSEKKELRMLNPDLDTIETPLTYESLVESSMIAGMFLKQYGKENVIIHDLRGKVYPKPTFDKTFFYKTMKK